MLQKIRNQIQGWVAVLILAILTAGFLMWGVEYYIEQSGHSQEVAAKVNGVEISQKQLDNAVQQLQRSQQQGNAPLSDDQRQQLKQMALQQLVGSSALVQAAYKSGFRVGIDELKQLIVTAPQFQVNGKFSEQRFRELLYANASTPQEFFTMLQSSLLTDQVSVGIQQSAFVLPNELKRTYELLKEKRSFGYLIIPAARFQSSIPVSQAEMESYFRQNSDEFTLPEKASVNYLILSPQEISKSIRISDQEVAQYYQNNMQDSGKSLAEASPAIRANLTQQKADQLFSKKSDDLTNITFTNPTSLDPAAKALGLSINTSTLMTREGEKSGVFSDPKVLSVIFSDDVLQQKNNSNPIELKDGGLMVVHVADYQPGKVADFDQVEKTIKDKLQQQKAERKAGLVAYQIVQGLKSGLDPQKLAKDNHLQWIEKNSVTRTDKTVPDEIINAAFSIAFNNAEKNQPLTTVLRNSGDSVVILNNQSQLGDFKQITPSELKTLSNNLVNFQGQLDYRFYVNSVMRQTKISTKSK